MQYKISCVKFVLFENIDEYAIRVKNGDIEAFNEIDKEVRIMLKKLINKYSINYHDKQDIEQMLMENAIYLCKKYDHTIGPFKHYLYRSWRFEILNYFTYDQRHKNLIERITTYEQTNIEAYDEYIKNYPEASVLKKEYKERFLYDPSPYSKREARTLELLVKGFTIKEVADALQTEKKLVLNTIYRIRDKQERLANKDAVI